MAMKDLLYSVQTAFQTAITAGDLNATRVYLGFQDNPEQIARKHFPYISIDDGGERTTTEGVEGDDTYNRIYSIVIEMAVWKNVLTDALDDILDLSDEAKTVLELEVNRFKDSHIWGVNIIPFGWNAEEKYFFRGRHVTVEYYDLEEASYNDY